jgi:two-component system sensor histidine kinase YesM
VINRLVLYRWIVDPFRRSIRNRLILVMVVLSVFPVTVVTLLATENTRISMEREIIQSNLSTITWTGHYLEEKLSEINNLMYTILISPSYNEFASKADGSNNPNQYFTQKNLIDTVSSIYYTGNNNLSGIQLYFKETNSLFKISSSLQTVINSPNVIPLFYQNVLSQNGDFLIQNSDTNEKKFNLIRSINRFENRERIGAISLEVKWKIADNAIELLNPDKEHTVLIADRAGNVMYQPAGTTQLSTVNELLKEDMVRELGYIQTQDYYIFYNTIEPWGLKLVKMIPVLSINQSANKILHYGFIVGAVSIIVSMLITVILAWKISKPIVTLARSMQSLAFIKDEDMSLSNRIDEIGMLESKMQTMSYRIREHIKTEYMINLEKRTAQLKALQAQINPHFLQNTLQLIGGMAFSQSPDRLYAVIKSLSEMFRYVIREPSEWVTLENEINHLKNYVFIQEQRFSNRIVTAVNIELGIESCIIPKLTIQPIVENAFMHGLDKKSGNWSLKVTAVQDEQGILISIEDNGVGMSSDQLHKLSSELQIHSDTIWTSGDHIGLSNVAARIKMQFGAQYGITIDSELNVGTIVHLHIPMVKDGRKYE